MRSRSVALAIASSAIALVLVAAPALATVVSGLDTVSGYAYGESVDVTTLAGAIHVTSGPLPTAGPLPASGGNFTNSAASACAGTINIPSCNGNVLTAGVLNVHTEGTTGPTGAVGSTASVATVNALAGLVTGTLIASQCAVNSSGATSGSSTLTNVQVNGVVVATTPAPNTTLLLLDGGSVAAGHVILNEQIYNSGTNTLTVNAIHIKLDVGGGTLGTGDIIISHVECDATPAGPAPVIPESPLAILLPITALMVVAGTFLLTIRRRAVVGR
jgi:hypothetical protein